MREDYLRVRREFVRKPGLYDYWRAKGFSPQCRAKGDDDFECDIPEVKNK